jgi:hypothetical protein
VVNTSYFMVLTSRSVRYIVVVGVSKLYCFVAENRVCLIRQSLWPGRLLLAALSRGNH